MWQSRWIPNHALVLPVSSTPGQLPKSFDYISNKIMIMLLTSYQYLLKSCTENWKRKQFFLEVIFLHNSVITVSPILFIKPLSLLQSSFLSRNYVNWICSSFDNRRTFWRHRSSFSPLLALSRPLLFQRFC